MAQNNPGNFLWFVAGAAIGATVALLYAPQSGEKTRKILKARTREGREALMENSQELMDKGRELYEKGLRVADEAAELIERGRKIVEG
jgi:gas vesicle protein